MKKYTIAGMGILILVLITIVCPAGAFTAKNLDITIQDNTNAMITFSYDLSWYEKIAVFSRIADPGAELTKTLRIQFRKNVVGTSVTGNSAQFMVENFASRTVKDGAVSLNTPSLSFKNAEKALNKYWFFPLISPDFSPEITRVSFPDGYSEEFYNQDFIPPLHHTLGMPA